MRLALAGIFVFAACAPSTQTVRTGRFIPDERIAAVKICATHADDAVRAFGQPTQRGHESGFDTLQWTAMTTTSDGESASMRYQNVLVWVDSAGLVAGLVVNPTSMPVPPKACASTSQRG